MTTVVLILMILVCFNFLLKQTFVSLRTLAVTTLILGVFAALMWQVAIEQSKTQIADWLQNTSLMRDMAVILNVDVAAQLAFCIFTVRGFGSSPKPLRDRIIAKALALYPGFIIFPVVLAALVQLIFMLPGVSFTLVSSLLGVAIIVFVPLGAMLLRRLLPEADLRLELLFLSNVLVALIGVVATVNGGTINSPVGGVDLSALAGFIALLVIGCTVGVVWNRCRQKRMFNKQQLQK